MFSSSQKTPLGALLHRPRPSPWSIFWRSPVVYLARFIYNRRRITFPDYTESAVSVVCISDTHNSQPQLPYADILIHAGDLTHSGSLTEIQQALDWIKQATSSHKIAVAGNHDLLLDLNCDARSGGGEASSERLKLSWGDITYLQTKHRDFLWHRPQTAYIWQPYVMSTRERGFSISSPPGS